MGNSVKFSIDKYLTVCGQVEKYMADIYGHWSQDPDHDEQVGELWRTLESEENGHFKQIELLRRMSRGSELVVSKISDAYALRLAGKAQQALESVRKTSMPVRSAIVMAIHLEELFKDFHVYRAVVCQDVTLGMMFKNLSRDDDAHAERLKKTYKSLYSDDPPINTMADEFKLHAV